MKIRDFDAEIFFPASWSMDKRSEWAYSHGLSERPFYYVRQLYPSGLRDTAWEDIVWPMPVNVKEL